MPLLPINKCCMFICKYDDSHPVEGCWTRRISIVQVGREWRGGMAEGEFTLCQYEHVEEETMV